MKKRTLENMTIASMILFEVLIIFMPMTSYGNSGNANRFGSKGMIYSMVLIALMYIIPLLFYKLHIKTMKYIIAIIIGICTIGSIFIAILLWISIIFQAKILGIFFFQLSAKQYMFHIISEIVSIAIIVINIIWYKEFLLTNTKKDGENKG